MKVDRAKRLKDPEKENARLKRLLADAGLDKAILKEAASGNRQALPQASVHRACVWRVRRLGTPGLPGGRPVPVDSMAKAAEAR